MSDREVSMKISSAMSTDIPGSVVEIKPRNGWLDLDLPGVWRYRELLVFLVLRDMKVRYKQAALGAAWTLIQPTFAVLIFTLVFGIFAKLPSEGIPYPLFALSAVLPWLFFSEATRRAALGRIGDGALVSKVYFPRLVVPLSNVMTPAADFFVSLFILLPVMLWYGVMPTWNMLFLPVLLIITLLLGLAIGLWLGPINVRYRDITHTLPFVLQIWMYATPIVYPLNMIPESWRTLYSLNPMVGLIEGFRWALLGRDDLDLGAIGIGLSVTLVLLVGGLIFFRRAERQFADII
jgi:lipopolysaccharide transport system permease protein